MQGVHAIDAAGVRLEAGRLSTQSSRSIDSTEG